MIRADDIEYHYYLPHWPAFVRWVSAWAMVLGLSAGLLNAADPLPKPWSGRCVAIHDGDTCLVLRAGKRQAVRLHGVDAPEIKQAAGIEARDYLAKVILSRRVRVTPRGWSWKRLVATVERDKDDVGVLMVDRGWAWQDPRYSRDKEMAAAQAAAQMDRRGLWRGNSPIPPWDFRKNKK